MSRPLLARLARAGGAGGLLIQAAVGSGGGTGTPRGKRAGLKLGDNPFARGCVLLGLHRVAADDVGVGRRPRPP
jgi:hypothetical protein